MAGQAALGLSAQLPYDPGNVEAFWAGIGRLPGFPPEDRGAVRSMHFAADALDRLPAVLGAIGADPQAPIFVVLDATPMRRDGQQLKPAVLQRLANGGWTVQVIRIEPDASGQVHTEMPRIQAIVEALRPGCAVLSVGSGTVTDLAKHACHLAQTERGFRPLFVEVPTANSVNAYTSNMAPVFVSGVKRTLASRYPDATVWDLATLRDAPAQMSSAGVGDLLAAFVSLPDWLLAHRLGMDPGYNDLPRQLIGPLDRTLPEVAAGVRRGDLQAHALLARLIAVSGFGMSFVRASTPASGFEHVISHTLDLQGERAGRPLPVHGLQVGLASVLAAETYRLFLADTGPKRVDRAMGFPDDESMRRQIDAAMASVDPSGAAAAECWRDYQVKLAGWREQESRIREVLADWPSVRAEIAAMTRPPEALADILSAAGAPLAFDQLTPPLPEDSVRFAFVNAPFARRRLTLGDLLVFFGWDRQRLWEQVWRRLQALLRPAAS